MSGTRAAKITIWSSNASGSNSLRFEPNFSKGFHHVMSAITDWAAQEQADLLAISAALDTIVAGIANLDTRITNFRNSPGTLSAADQAALDAIQSASKDLKAKASAISVAPPVPPTNPTGVSRIIVQR